jgi:hypothetical protein
MVIVLHPILVRFDLFTDCNAAKKEALTQNLKNSKNIIILHLLRLFLKEYLMNK